MGKGVIWVKGQNEVFLRNKGFILFQILLYAVFLTLDITGLHNTLSIYVKYIVVILCFCYALFQRRSDNKGIVFSYKAALLFTVISDFFILITDHYYYGVLTFIVVQIFYTVALLQFHTKGGILIKKMSISLIKRLLAVIIVIILLDNFDVTLDRLLIVSVIYFVFILSNTITAVKMAFGSPNNKSLLLFAIGMVLFVLCDINVGLFNMSAFIPLPANLARIIYEFSSILMWTFYAPSQVLITLCVSILPSKASRV